MRGVRPLAPELGARHRARVPPDLGPLGARRAPRAGHRRRTTATSSTSASRSRLGLPRVLGLAPGDQDDFAALGRRRASRPRPTSSRPSFGMRELPVTEVTPDALLAFNDPDVRRVGMPGGGGVDPRRRPGRLLPGAAPQPGRAVGAGRPRRRHRPRAQPLPRPPDAGVPANRTLGAGPGGRRRQSHFRGMGHAVSPRTFGHNGAGGQIAWADPTTGLSFGYVTNGLRPARHPRAPPHDRPGQPRRGLRYQLDAASGTRDASQTADVDGDRELLGRRGADDDTAEGRDVAVVAAPGHGDVAGRGDLVVGRVEVEPAPPRQVRRAPGVRSVGADQLGWPGGASVSM